MISLNSATDWSGGGARPLPTLRDAESAAKAPEVEVWRADLDAQPVEAMLSLEAILAADEAARARGFYFERDRQRFIAARGILRMLLGGYLGRPAAAVAFRYGAHGKPALADPRARLYFNVAHSEGLAVYAFSRVGEVGIDVECLRELPDWEQVAEAAFSAHELTRLRAAPAATQRDEFFRAWTRQEAVLKALGTGLADTGQVVAESAFTVYPLEVGAGFAAALACSPAARRPEKIRGWTESAGTMVSSERTLLSDLL